MTQGLKIVFHGENARNFMDGFADLLPPGRHTVEGLGAGLKGAGERESFEAADVVVGIRLDESLPVPAACRLFHAPSAGTDPIDVMRLPKGAVLCNCFGHEAPIAEYIFAALLARHVPLAEADANLRQGKWSFHAGRPGALRTELADQTIGLLGYGHIGKAVAVRAKAFGMRVVVCNRSAVATSDFVDEAYSLDQLHAFMGAADAIVVSLPLAPETQGLVDAAALGAMRPDGVIVNVGRGPIIAEEALFTALSERRIAGAVIDTWYTYPSAKQPECQPSTFAFSSLDNVVMSPHMSGWTGSMIRRRQQTIADNVRRLVTGEPLVNVVHRG